MSDDYKNYKYDRPLLERLRDHHNLNTPHAHAMQEAADEIEKLRKALTAILNDVGYKNPMRMTTEISDKILEDAKGALNDNV